MSNADISDPGHGHSVASWAAVTVMMVGFAIGAFGFWFVSMWMNWVAVVLVFVVGPLVGFILMKLGYGVNGSRSAVKNSP